MHGIVNQSRYGMTARPRKPGLLIVWLLALTTVSVQAENGAHVLSSAAGTPVIKQFVRHGGHGVGANRVYCVRSFVGGLTGASYHPYRGDPDVPDTLEPGWDLTDDGRVIPQTRTVYSGIARFGPEPPSTADEDDGEDVDYRNWVYTVGGDADWQADDMDEDPDVYDWRVTNGSGDQASVHDVACPSAPLPEDDGCVIVVGSFRGTLH